LAKYGKAQEMMNPFDENSPTAPEPGDVQAEPQLNAPPSGPSQDFRGQQEHSASDAPIFPVTTESRYPADLQITWSWAHFVIFIFFAFISLILIQGIMAVHYAPHESMSNQQLEQYLLSKPQFVLGSMVIWYAVIFFFLYITLSVLRGHSFWECLGWRKIKSFNAGPPKNPAFFLLAGAGLSLAVAVLSSRMKAPENTPVEELFKYRQTALLFIAMAVLIAPLVEETLFRGYLYPMFARSFGIWPGIILTGVLFGFMHGAQLGWTWSLVSVLIMVGIIFTFVRARTGSVFASFLMHLGYNSLISVFALIGTHGFSKLPPGQ
jgi:membrane protease YdiL (CAAX protease family)